MTTPYCQNNLKRHRFAESIRQKTKDKWKQQIRERNQKRNQLLYTGQYFDQKLYLTLRSVCLKDNFSANSIIQFVKYTCIELQLSCLAQQRIIKFLIEISENIVGSKKQQWQTETLIHIEKSIRKILKYQIDQQNFIMGNLQKMQPDSSVTKQLCQLHLLRNSFNAIFKLVSHFSEYIQLWPQIANVYNQELSEFSLKSFEDLISKIIGSLSSDDISTVLITIQNFINNPCLNGNDKISLIENLDQILQNYHLSSYDLKILIHTVMFWLHTDTKHQNLSFKVMLLSKTTKLIQNIVIYIDRSEPDYKDTPPDLVTYIAKFIAKIFCADDETCYKAYYTIMRVIQYLRSWLPAQRNVTKIMLQQSHRGHLMHSNHHCTQSVLYALSNIVATDSNFVQIFLKTDVYRAFIYLFPLVPEKCRVEIAACIFNMVFKNNHICLNIMLETKLPEIILQMLAQKNEQIIEKALQMSIYIYEDLSQQDYQNHPQFYTVNKFISTFQRIGIFCQCQKLVFHENPKVSSLTGSFLEIVDHHKNKNIIE